MSHMDNSIDDIKAEELLPRNSPALQTARGKLQKERSKLNEKINRQFQLRHGAENLLRATQRTDIKDTVSLELKFVNSALQSLREELSDLNCSLNDYQHDGIASGVPMIALGLKETKDVDFKTPINDFIAEHYGEDAELYADAVQELTDLRKATRTPGRNSSGIDLLIRYVNHLTQSELRFFPRRRTPGLHFQWYDAFTGLPDCQKSIGFEKGSVIFNIAALCSQVATKRDRTTKEGIGKARSGYQRAAGSLVYLRDKFSHAPSRDMQTDTIEALIALMLAQSEECVLEERVLGGVKTDMMVYAEVAQIYSTVAHAYQEVTSRCKDETAHLPRSWISMMEVKAAHYTALSHYYVSLAISDMSGAKDESQLQDKLPGVYAHLHNRKAPKHPVCLKHQREEVLGELRESLLQHDQALHVVEINKHLRKMDTLFQIVTYAKERTSQRYKSLKDPTDYSDLLQCPAVPPDTANALKPTVLNLEEHPVEDLFKKLGPLWLFCADREWTSARHVTMERDDVTTSYGFSIRGGAPVAIEDIEIESIAEAAGLKPGDVIISIDGVDSKWLSHAEACDKIRLAEHDLKIQLVVVTPKACSEPSHSIHSNTSTLRIAMTTPSGTLCRNGMIVSVPELGGSLDNLTMKMNGRKTGKLSWAFRKRGMIPTLGRR